jgi:hypothetical protein
MRKGDGMGFFIHKKEKHIVELIKKHVETVVEAVHLVQQCLNALLEGDVEQAAQFSKHVHRKEHEADMIQREIDTELFGGAFMPSIREVLFMTVDSVDKVANRAEKLGDFITLITPGVPEEIRDDLHTMGELTYMGARKLQDAVKHLFSDIQQMHTDTIEVERLEAEVDKYAWKVLVTIFKQLEIEKFSHRMMLREMVIHLASISNKMEDTSDRLDVIALKLLS